MKTILCPHCGQPHALFWFIHASENSKALKYTCNKVSRKFKHDGGVIGFKSGTGSFEVPRSEWWKYENNPEIPVLWSKKRIKKEQKKLQGNLL